MVKMAAPVAVAGLIFFGTSCSLLAKLIYSVTGANLYGENARYEKPWFQVLAMFMGMSVCILLDLPRRDARRTHRPPPDSTPSVWIISIPTLFDLFATACGTTGLLYTTVSVYQMLRGAMLVWTAVLSIIFLRRRLSALNYMGIVLCVSGIVLVGIANIYAEENPRSRSDTVFGILIILLGQVLQAAQVVMEEFLLQDLRLSSVRVVAWEGLFGILHCVAWVFPIIYFLPGGDHGHLEDVFDALYMLTHSWAVAGIIFTDMTMMLFYNICGMEVTDSLSAVHRVVIETLRTVCVWIVDLVIFYGLSDGALGEAWTAYSWLQLAGFMLLVAGTIVYNYENLRADYEKRSKTEPSVAAVDQISDYESLLVKVKQDETTPLAVSGYYDEELRIADSDEEEEEDEFVGSFIGSAVGSVAHSPFLASATPPTSLRHRFTP